MKKELARPYLWYFSAIKRLGDSRQEILDINKLRQPATPPPTLGVISSCQVSPSVKYDRMLFPRFQPPISLAGSYARVMPLAIIIAPAAALYRPHARGYPSRCFRRDGGMLRIS